MQITNFQGDVTDISAKKEPQPTSTCCTALCKLPTRMIFLFFVKYPKVANYKKNLHLLDTSQ